jgi:hypothetical protein
MGIAATPKPDHSENCPLEVPRARVAWTRQELRSLARLISQPAAEPAAALIRAIRGDA